MVTATLTTIYPKSKLLDCPECGGQMVLRKSPKYPNPFYGCADFPYCKATHGAHPNGAPLGTPADAETKKCRIETHAVFDKLWGRHDEELTSHNRKANRKIAYRWLAKQLGIKKVGSDCHIALFDIEKCQLAIEHCQNTTWEKILAWHSLNKPPEYKPKKHRKRRPSRYAHY